VIDLALLAGKMGTGDGKGIAAKIDKI